MPSLVAPAVAIRSTLLAVALFYAQSQSMAPAHGMTAQFDDRWTSSYAASATLSIHENSILSLPGSAETPPTYEVPAAIGRDGNALSADEIALGEKIRRTLALYEPKHLNARDQSSWDSHAQPDCLRPAHRNLS